jgi:parallel beta-helix repeat protein
MFRPCTRAAIGACALIALATLPALAAEGRTPVYLDGTVIATDGRYVLTRSIFSAGAGTPVIDIAAPNVELDLNGFTIFGSNGTPAILISAPPVDVRIHNGRIVGGDNSVLRPLAGVGRSLILEDLRSENALGTAFELHELESVVLRRNTVLDAGGAGIDVADPPLTDGSISDNTILRTAFDAIDVEEAAAMELVRNQIQSAGSAGGGVGIAVSRAIGCRLADNVIAGTEGEGIVLKQSQGNKLVNNVVRRASATCIHLDANSSDNLLLDNVGTECGFGTPPGHGLWVESARNHVENNTWNGNQACGLLFDATSSLNVFGRNMARGNSPGGPGTGCFVFPCVLLFPPDSCDVSGASNDTNLENMIPGPPPF